MNYSVVIRAFIFLFATVLWLVWVRKVYSGPISDVESVSPFVEEKYHGENREHV
jgi:hypothetical protein